MDRLACVELPGLTAGEVPALIERLRRFSPHVEPCDEEPAIFWLDASGLDRLYPSLVAWARAIRKELGPTAKVAVGFRRFATYVAARAGARRGLAVFSDPDEEDRVMRRAPFTLIGLDPDARVALTQLAVRTVGDFLALPHAGIRKRFGREAHRLHQLASDELWSPLQPRPVEEKLERSHDLDEPVAHHETLLFLVKRELDPLLQRLAERGEALTELRFGLAIERHPPREETVRPAEPSLECPILLELVRLRLETLALLAGVTRVTVAVSGMRATAEQLRLFARKPRRDPRAAGRAIARVRAALGAQAVVRAELRNGHLPEARFAWAPIDTLTAPRPRAIAEQPMHPPHPIVRRLEAQPIPLPPRPAREPDGWLLRGLRHGPVDRLDGPYLLSGGWWQTALARDYYFAELRSGEIYWIYFDRHRRRWFLQGQVA